MKAKPQVRVFSRTRCLAKLRKILIVGNVSANAPVSRSLLVEGTHSARIPRGCRGGTFSRTTASARCNLTVQEGRRRANTLDKLESCLSARLPRIMDATVTHVNEAHHLHLLYLPALPIPPLTAAETFPQPSIRPTSPTSCHRTTATRFAISLLSI